MALLARREAELRALAEEIERGAGTASVTRPIWQTAGATRAAVEAAGERLGRLDVVVYARGRTSPPVPAVLSPADWDALLAANLSGAFAVTQARCGCAGRARALDLHLLGRRAAPGRLGGGLPGHQARPGGAGARDAGGGAGARNPHHRHLPRPDRDAPAAEAPDPDARTSSPGRCNQKTWPGLPLRRYPSGRARVPELQLLPSAL